MSQEILSEFGQIIVGTHTGKRRIEEALSEGGSVKPGTLRARGDGNHRMY